MSTGKMDVNGSNAADVEALMILSIYDLNLCLMVVPRAVRSCASCDKVCFCNRIMCGLFYQDEADRTEAWAWITIHAIFAGIRCISPRDTRR